MNTALLYIVKNNLRTIILTTTEALHLLIKVIKPKIFWGFEGEAYLNTLEETFHKENKVWKTFGFDLLDYYKQNFMIQSQC